MSLLDFHSEEILGLKDEKTTENGQKFEKIFLYFSFGILNKENISTSDLKLKFKIFIYSSAVM